jgi:hypothetical protein
MKSIAPSITLGLLSITIAISNAGFANVLSDSWARIFFSKREDFFYILAFGILMTLTVGIAKKQHDYYYKELGIGKEGIFINNIRQVNYLEDDLDLLLGISGILLFPFTIFPVFWFLMLNVYSIFVVIRCVFTLGRKSLAQRLTKRGESVPTYYSELKYPETRKRHHDEIQYKVRVVLGGWIITHSVIALSAITIFSFFFLKKSSLYAFWFSSSCL